MRLTDKQIVIIKESFKECFLFGDKLFLFGSRVDDSKRGGDIDLYIETNSENSDLVYKQKSKFNVLLQVKLGEQKIDIVVKTPSDDLSRLIYQEAQRTGVLIMEKKVSLEINVAAVERHLKRLEDALFYVLKNIPITAQDIENLPSQDISYMDMLSIRFSKIQDLIGARIFPLILELSEEKEFLTVIDRLNRLEKLNFIDDANWWIGLRNLRNNMTHDYPDDTITIAKTINDLVVKSQQLLVYWNELKPKLGPFIEEEKKK